MKNLSNEKRYIELTEVFNQETIKRKLSKMNIKLIFIGLIIISIIFYAKLDKGSPPITTNYTVYGANQEGSKKTYNLSLLLEDNMYTGTKIVYNPDIDYINYTPSKSLFGKKLTISIVSQASHGIAKADYDNFGNPIIAYTQPTAYFVGTDTITYKVNYGNLESNTSSIVYVISRSYAARNEIEDFRKQNIYKMNREDLRDTMIYNAYNSSKSSGCSSKGCTPYSDWMIQERAKNHYWDKYGLAARAQNCNPSAGTVRKNGDIYTVSIFCGANNPKDYKLRCCNGKLEIISVN